VVLTRLRCFLALSGLVFLYSTVEYWKTQPTGVVSMMLLCVGDGLADLIGRRYGRRGRLFWSPKKSLVGSLAFIIGSLISAALFIHWGYEWGWFHVSLQQYWPTLLVVTLVAAFVESLPIPEVDNLTIVAAAVYTEKMFQGR